MKVGINMITRCRTCGADMELSSDTDVEYDCEACETDHCCSSSIFVRLGPKLICQSCGKIISLDFTKSFNTSDEALAATTNLIKDNSHAT